MSDRLAEIEAIEQRARAELYGLCSGERKFTMRIPVQEDDTDMVIDAAFNALRELIAEVRRLREQADVERAAAMEALRLMGDRAREAGELRGERDWLRRELRRAKATPYVAEECDDLRAAWRSEDSPAYGAPIRLHFNTPPKELRYVKAVVTRVDRPGPRRMDDDEETAYAPDVETPQRERLHTLVYDVGEESE